MRCATRAELEKRTAKMQEAMGLLDLDGAIIVQNADLFYFTGTVQRSHLFIPAAGKPVLLVKKTYERAKKESALENVLPLKHIKELPEKLQALGYGNLKRIGFELDVLPANLYFYYRDLFSPAEIVDIGQMVRTVRAVKSPYEIESIKDAARLNQAMFSRVREFLREGMTEVELASKLEAVYRLQGHQGFIRTRNLYMEAAFGHLMSGWNLAVPSYFDGATGGSGLHPSFPQSACFKVIGRNEPVMVDYVGVYGGYMVDQTRIFCIGRLPEKLTRAHEVALEIQEAVKERAKPGVTCGELYELAVRMAGKKDLKEHFMGYPNPVSFIGHGVGIEMDELPILSRGSKTVLEEGMVIALEPKFVFPEGAVGIENTFVVTSEGLEVLTVFDDGIGYVP